MAAVGEGPDLAVLEAVISAPTISHDESTTPHHEVAHRFHDMPISSDILRILDHLKFVTPTPIQSAAIPLGLDGKDLIGIAQTGTGKTLAFGIPMVQRLKGQRARGLVVVPTRELALQVAETLHRLSRPLRMSTVVLIGGAPMGPQKAALRGDPQMVVATPGRLIDHLEQGSVSLESVRVLVLDEADRMLDMGFAPQINRILRATPRERQTLLFSATMPSDIVEIAMNQMRLPISVEIAPPGTTVEDLTQELMVVKKEGKTPLLLKLLEDYKGTVLVFSRTKHGAKKILRDLLEAGHSAAEMHSNRSLSQRRDALEGFRTGRYRVLVATDIASRGIDVTNIQLVVNYDIPDQAEDYVHRVGRTGRAGRTGHAISFATPDQGSEVQSIEKLIRSQINISPESEHEFERTIFPAKRGRSAQSVFSRPPSSHGSRSSVGARSGMEARRAPRPRPDRTTEGSETRPDASASKVEVEGRLLNPPARDQSVPDFDPPTSDNESRQNDSSVRGRSALVSNRPKHGDARSKGDGESRRSEPAARGRDAVASDSPRRDGHSRSSSPSPRGGRRPDSGARRPDSDGRTRPHASGPRSPNGSGPARGMRPRTGGPDRGAERGNGPQVDHPGRAHGWKNSAGESRGENRTGTFNRSNPRGRPDAAQSSNAAGDGTASEAGGGWLPQRPRRRQAVARNR